MNVEVDQKSVEFYIKNNGFHPSEANEEQQKQEYFRLRDFGASRGRKPGWAFHAWKETFGTTDLPDEWKVEYESRKVNSAPAVSVDNTPRASDAEEEDAMRVLGVKRGTSVSDIQEAVKHKINVILDAQAVLIG